MPSESAIGFPGSVACPPRLHRIPVLRAPERATSEEEAEGVESSLPKLEIFYTVTFS